MSSLKIGRHTIQLSNEDKIIFPKTNITKNELITYYQRIAPTMLPYLHNRPIVLQRFPNGITEKGFFQKNAGDYFPSWITTQAIKHARNTVDYVVCNNAATLVYLANQLCLTPHIWLSTTDKLDFPDRMIFDLDPAGADFSLVLNAAKKVKKSVEENGLVAFVMTTGSRGLHVVVPLKRTKKFDFVRSYAHNLALQLVEQYPDEFTVQMRKDQRNGKVFIDYLRNSFSATGVCPYAVRPYEGAPIATPLAWNELKKGLSPRRYTIKNIFKRLARRNDPWRDIDQHARALSIIIVSIYMLLAIQSSRAASDPNKLSITQQPDGTIQIVNNNQHKIEVRNDPDFEDCRRYVSTELVYHMASLSPEALVRNLAVLFSENKLHEYLNAMTLCQIGVLHDDRMGQLITVNDRTKTVRQALLDARPGVSERFLAQLDKLAYDHDLQKAAIARSKLSWWQRLTT